MKVKLLVSRSSVDFVQNAGDVIEVSDKEGERMIAAHQALPVREEKREKAVRSTKREKAVK